MPWYQLSIDMDPQLVDSYLVAAYWLRTNLKRPDEAERVLMQGLRANPENPEILVDLGRLELEYRHDPARARRDWERALVAWKKASADAAEPDYEPLYAAAGYLAHLDELDGRYADALRELESARSIHDLQRFDGWIERLRAKLAAPAPR
jgi:hypothetical protein